MEKKLDYIREVFAKSFFITRKWEVIFNRLNADDDITLKQLMLLIVVKNAFRESPTIKEIANVLTTSHQNVKAILNQLEKKEFIITYGDLKDKRVTRVKIADGKDAYWKKKDIQDIEILLSLFENISVEDLEVTARTIGLLDEIASKKINKT